MKRSLAARRGTAAILLLLALAGAGCTAGQPEPASTSPAPTSPPASSGTPSTGTPSTGTPSTGTPDSGPPTGAPPPPATTPVPPPTPGTVQETVEPGTDSTREPVELDQPSDAGGGVTARITAVKEIRATARQPGEVAGPAVAVTLQVRNGSRRALDLTRVVVTLADADQAPGGEMTAAPAKPLTGRLAPGRTAVGTYVFTVPERRRAPVTVTVTLDPGLPVLVFTGDVG